MPVLNGKFYPDTQEGRKKYQEDAFKDHESLSKSTTDREKRNEKKVIKGSKRR